MAEKKESIRASVNVESELYEEAKKVLDKIGLNFNGAVILFLKKLVIEKKLPFNLTSYSEREVESMDEKKRLERLMAYFETFNKLNKEK